MNGITCAYAQRGGEWLYGFGVVTEVDHDAETITVHDAAEDRTVVVRPIRDGFVPCASWRGVFLAEVA